MMSTASNGALRFIRRVCSRLHLLLFDPAKEARLSIGVARIGLAVSLLWTLWNYHKYFSTFGGIAGYAQSFAHTKYYHFGLVQLFGDRLPSPELLALTFNVAVISAAFALVGLFSRPATIIAVVSALFITSYKEGSYPYWSHGYVVVMVAGLAFMFGQSGASFSLDRLLAKRFPRYPFRAETSLGYWWPVACGQAAVALFYFGAGMAKHINGGLWDWVFSDGLRNSLAVTWYGYTYFDVPPYIEYLMNTQWLWTAAAGAHVATQFYPVLAVLHKNNPWLRLSEGAVYFGGVFLLFLVMTVWNPVWLPLTVFFVDWDWVKRGFKPPALAPQAQAPASVGPRTAGNLAAMSFVYAFFAVYISTFTFQLGHWHLFYPFSSLDFYSDVKAKRPYDKHQPYDFYRGQVRVRLERCDLKAADWPDDAKVRKSAAAAAERDRLIGNIRTHCADNWFRYPNFTSTYPEFYRIQNAEEMKGALNTTYQYITNHQADKIPGVKEVVVEKAIWAYPAYPNPAKPVATHYGARGYLDVESGAFRYVDSKYYRDQPTQELRLDVEAVGFKDPVIEAFYRHNVRDVSAMPPLKPMKGRWTTPTRFVIDEMEGAWEKPAFTLFRIRERAEPAGRVWEFWGADNLS